MSALLSFYWLEIWSWTFDWTIWFKNDGIFVLHTLHLLFPYFTWSHRITKYAKTNTTLLPRLYYYFSLITWEGTMNLCAPPPLHPHLSWNQETPLTSADLISFCNCFYKMALYDKDTICIGVNPWGTLPFY